nr:hypothetical protein [Tanacetum cinerariifolium]
MEGTMHSTQLFWEFNTRDLIPDLELQRLTSLVGITLLSITCSLDATFDMDVLLGCLMYEFWTCELAVSNLSPANRRSSLSAIQCLERCCLDAGVIAFVVRKLH